MHMDLCLFFLLKILFTFYLFIYRERGREGEREREKHRCERNIDLLPLAHTLTGGLNRQPRHGPRPEIKPVTFHFVRRHPNSRATLPRAVMCLFLDFLFCSVDLYLDAMSMTNHNHMITHMTPLITLFVTFFNYFIIVQLQLSSFSPHHFPPPQPIPPPSLVSTLPLGFVHVSFIAVPENPSSHCPLPSPLWLLLDCS